MAVLVHSLDIHGKKKQNISGIARREADIAVGTPAHSRQLLSRASPVPVPSRGGVTRKTARLFFPSGGGGSSRGRTHAPCPEEPGQQPTRARQPIETDGPLSCDARARERLFPSPRPRPLPSQAQLKVGRRISHHWPSGHRASPPGWIQQLPPVRGRVATPTPHLRARAAPGTSPRARHGAASWWLLSSRPRARSRATFTCRTDRANDPRFFQLWLAAGVGSEEQEQHYTTRRTVPRNRRWSCANGLIKLT